MAFFGLGAVFDTLTSTARTGTRENPTVASYNGGDFTRDQISGMTRAHYATRRFLSELRNLGVEKRGDQFVDLVRPIRPIQDNGQQEYVDEQIIGRMLMAKKAEAEGLMVSDNMIDQYLFATYGVIDEDGLSKRDLELLNRDVNNGQVSMAAIRRHLKMELLNQQMVTLSFTGIPRVPNPLESVQHYAKVNQKVDCEIFPVSISEYVDNDAMPTQSEIRDLYEEGKYEFKDPTGKRPGFKMARRMKLQYFVGDYQDFLDKAAAGLSDEELQTKYDELVAQESEMVMEIVIDENEGDSDMPAINLEGDDDAAQGDASDDAEEEAAPQPSEPASDDQSNNQSHNVRSSASKFVLVSMPVQEETPTVDVPGVEVPVPEVLAGDGPVADAVEVVADKVEGAVEVAEGATEAVESAMEVPETTETPAVEMKTELVEEPAAKELTTEAATPEVEVGTKTAPVVVENQSKIESAAESESPEASEATPAVSATAEQGQADAAADVGGIGDMQDLDIGPMLTDDDDIVKRAKPLDEVADLIRRQLKGAEAESALKTAIATAENEVENYFRLRLQWEVNGKEKNRPAPEAPDFQAIADKYGLRLAGTELVDNEEMMKTELGGIYEIFNVQGRSVPVPMADVIFNKFNSLTEYDSTTTNNRFTGKSYVYWPTELADSKVPSLEECKEKIIEFWRQQKAVEAATEAAEGIAAKVSIDKKLSSIDPAKTIPTGEFTWFQPRGQRAVLSSPIGVDSPSEDFMATAFSLSEGEAGVAVDGSGETIFVIQSQTPKASMAEVGDDFLKNQLFRFQRLPPDVGLVSDHYFRQKTLDWNREYVDSMGFELMK
jgi:hypothetical protein